MKRLLTRTETYVFLAIIVFSAVITSVNRSYLSLENLFDLLKSYTVLGIFAAGVLVVIVSGGIDISFAAMATVAQYAAVVVAIRYGIGLSASFLLAGMIGLFLGLINALLIFYIEIPTIIATIATMNIFYGVLIMVTGGKWIYALPESFRSFADARVFTLYGAGGGQYGLAGVTVIWLVVALVTTIILRYSLYGRGIYALGGCGGDKGPARRAGLNVLRIQLFVYMYMGLLSGVAGIVQAVLVQTVAPNSIVGKELNVIAAVILGGASIAGGSGSMVGTFLGIALLAILSNGLTLMGVPSYWYDVLIGAVIIASVAVAAIRNKSKGKRHIEVEEATP